MVFIDKLAVVHEKAQIGANCQIGPFCTVGANVQIGDNTKLKSHVVVEGHTTIGSDCEIFPFVTLGIASQDLKHDPNSISYAAVGDRKRILAATGVVALPPQRCSGGNGECGGGELGVGPVKNGYSHIMMGAVDR